MSNFWAFWTKRKKADFSETAKVPVDCPYYCDSGTCIPLSLDIPNNVPAFIGDLLNVITAPFNIKIAKDNHKIRMARRKFKEKLINQFLIGKVYKKDRNELREWFAERCFEEGVALSIRDICAWEERLLLIQHVAKKSENDVRELFLGDKISVIKKQTKAGIIKHAVFGIAGILGICGITFGAVALSVALFVVCPIAIPLIAAVAFQGISGINTCLWSGANIFENLLAFFYADKKSRKWQKFDKISDKTIKKIYQKKLRNHKLRRKMEGRRALSLGALVGGAVGMSISSIMLATGTLLSSSIVGSAVGVPLIIAGGILGALGAISFIAGYAGNVWTRRKERQLKNEHRIADEAEDDSDIMKIIKKDPKYLKLQRHKKELYKVQQKGDDITLALSLAGLVAMIPAIPLSFLVPPLGIYYTIVGTSLLTAGIISSIHARRKAQNIRKKIVKCEYELVDKVRRKIPGYECMPIHQHKPTFWQKAKAWFKNIFSREKKRQKEQNKISEKFTKMDESTTWILETVNDNDERNKLENVKVPKATKIRNVENKKSENEFTIEVVNETIAEVPKVFAFKL